jgi:thiamine monophosphate synthase
MGHTIVWKTKLMAPQDYYESLEEALQGGVTVVQVREKDVDTGEVSRRLMVPHGHGRYTLQILEGHDAP